MKIIVTGATGRLGSLAIRHLLNKVPANGMAAVVRNLDKAAPLAELGIEIRQADYNNPESLQTAFQEGSKLLFISSSAADDPLRIVQHANVVKAARDQHIRHIAYTSFAFAEDNPFAHVHLATEYAIRTTHIPYTFLRNGGYADFFINSSLQTCIQNGVITTNTGKGKINAVSRNDLALAAATALTESGHENKSYNLVSNNPWSFDDLAAILTEVSGTSVIHQPISMEEEKSLLVRSGMPEALAEMTAFIYSTVAEGKMERTADDLQKLIGHTTSIKQLVVEALHQ
ncbi:NAD(P)H dehydrogenase (quinone) [Paenibacillus sp. UNCCL117]|uniref:SDR family oxidoreductase n=1 Tax=unclassified Paenibacillus TaxID=185978 RepID=UPI00088F9AF2|nr:MULTISPECIES: SDR family oxidoreductase [unclassified Paenibacillus]SDC55087.1 NAD(P)H dehydrogenase (quinone) [Paenibacillus sp. cl123]SFW10970.1 NAD(P)H dehydrogenase (quinone) [Paenibacillus sp. UNCCL117]